MKHRDSKGVRKSGPFFFAGDAVPPGAQNDLSSPHGDLVTAAIRSFGNVRSYRVTLRSKGAGFSEEIIYFYQEGFVRMELVRPHKGSILVYDPAKKIARLKPEGFLLPTLTLDPGNFLIRSSKGHRIDDSDIGSLLSAVEKLRSQGKTELIGEEAVGKRMALLMKVAGDSRVTVEGIHTYFIWFDREMLMPLKVSSYDISDKLIEEVLMDDLEINVEISRDLFVL